MSRIKHILLRTILLCSLLPLLSGCMITPRDLFSYIGDPDTTFSTPFNIRFLKAGDPSADHDRDRMCMSMRTAFDVPSTFETGLLVKDIPNGPQNVGPLDWIAASIEAQINDAVREIFTQMVNSPGFQNTLAGMMLLVVIFYGISVALGSSSAQPFIVVMTVIKLGAVSYLLANYNNFYIWVREPLENIILGLMAYMSTSFSGIQLDPNEPLNVFTPFSALISSFFSIGSMQVILALMLSGLSGLLYIIFFLFIFITYFLAVLMAVKVYLFTLVARGFLYALAPIFLLFLLFRQTQSLFQNWLMQLISFSLQPILVFTFLGLFNAMILSFIAGLPEIPPPPAEEPMVCYMKWFSILGFEAATFNWWSFSEDQGKTFIGGFWPDLPINLFVLQVLAIMTIVMLLFVKWAEQVASQIARAFTLASDSPIRGWEATSATIIGAANSPVQGVRGFLFGAIDNAGQRTGGILRGRNPVRGFTQAWKNAGQQTRRQVRRAQRSSMGLKE